MPIYEYRCDDKHRFEVRRSMSEANAPAYCPTCGAEGKRMLSMFAPLKGGTAVADGPRLEMDMPSASGGGCCGGSCGCGH